MDLLFVWEDSGSEQERELLDRMIGALGLSEGRYRIASVSDELGATLAALRPRAVVALGEAAAQATSAAGCRMISTWHPSHLIRHPEAKRETWAALQEIARELGIRIPVRGRSSG